MKFILLCIVCVLYAVGEIVDFKDRSAHKNSDTFQELAQRKHHEEHGCRRAPECSTFISNVKHNSPNIRLVYLASRSSCCGLCRTTGKCKCWSWAPPGECWMKEDCDKESEYRGFISGTPIVDSTKTCWLEKNYKNAGDNIKQHGEEFSEVHGFEVCCAKCRDHTGCIAVGFRPNKKGDEDGWGKCYLKYTSGHERIEDPENMAGYLSIIPVRDCNISVDQVWNVYPLYYPGTYPVNPAECCELCTESAICQAWNWLPDNGGICYFVGCASNATSYNGSISGFPSPYRQNVTILPPYKGNPCSGTFIDYID